jgi:Na+/proline symporter
MIIAIIICILWVLMGTGSFFIVKTLEELYLEIEQEPIEPAPKYLTVLLCWPVALAFLGATSIWERLKQSHVR